MRKITIGDNSKVTDVEKVKLHHKAIKAVLLLQKDLSEQAKDLKASAKADDIDVAALVKVIKAELRDEEATAREIAKTEQAQEYASVLQLTLDL